MAGLSVVDPPFAYTKAAKSMYSLSFLPVREDIDKFSQDDFEYYVMNDLNKPEYNTWDTWRLIPMNVPIVSPPQVSSVFTDLKDKDGQLDETTVWHPDTNIVYRQICSGKFDFYLDFSYLNIFKNFYNFYNNLLESLHGKKMILILNEDPIYMFFGRFFIEGITDNGDGGQVTLAISYNIEPYIYLSEGLSTYYLNGKESIETDRYRLDY